LNVAPFILNLLEHVHPSIPTGIEPPVQTQIIELMLEEEKLFKTILCDLSFKWHVMWALAPTQDRDAPSIAGIIKTGFNRRHRHGVFAMNTNAVLPSPKTVSSGECSGTKTVRSPDTQEFRRDNVIDLFSALPPRVVQIAVTVFYCPNQ
jgi:hypothetical protein